MSYQMCAGTVVIGLHVVVIQSLQHLAKEQNERIKLIASGHVHSKNKDDTRASVMNELEEEIRKHMALGEALGKVNDVFQVEHACMHRGDTPPPPVRSCVPYCLPLPCRIPYRTGPPVPYTVP